MNWLIKIFKSHREPVCESFSSCGTPSHYCMYEFLVNILTVNSSKDISKPIFRICGFVTSCHVTKCPLGLYQKRKKNKLQKGFLEKKIELGALPILPYIRNK